MKYLLILLMLAWTSQVGAQDAITIQPIADNVYVFFGNGGNILVATGEDGTMIVDDQFAAVSDEIKEKIMNLDGGTIKFVLNTHWHQDHTGGNISFGDSATIISHTNVRKRLQTDQFIEFFNKTVEASPKQALPIITFDESITIHFNQHEVSVNHLSAGHTDGDSYVYFQDINVLHAGDQFFNGIFPFIDLTHGGNIQGYIQNVQRLIDVTNDGTVVVPGHGPVGGKAELKNFQQMLVETSRIVAAQIEAQKSLETIQTKGLGDTWKEWGKGFLSESKWIEILYNGLS